MSLVQLQSFVAVAEEQHVGRAARRLHVTQPPLTRRIRALEDELGVSLFVRTPRGMQLCEAGERLLPRARRILAAVEEARRALSEPALPPDLETSSCSDPPPRSSR
jgi:DNA-binding transcriptional LysR family regulator